MIENVTLLFSGQFNAITFGMKMNCPFKNKKSLKWIISIISLLKRIGCSSLPHLRISLSNSNSEQKLKVENSWGSVEWGKTKLKLDIEIKIFNYPQGTDGLALNSGGLFYYVIFLK